MLPGERITEIHHLAQAEPWCSIYFAMKKGEEVEEVCSRFEEYGWVCTEVRQPPYVNPSLTLKKR